MDKNYLDKVVDQIVRETEIDYVKKRTYFPFSTFFYHHPNPIQFHPSPISHLFSSFSDHCKNIYGLNDDEVKYVWNEYKHIIKDKIS